MSTIRIETDTALCRAFAETFGGTWIHVVTDGVGHPMTAADAARAAELHPLMGGDLCMDADREGVCDVCNVLLTDCNVCGGTGYHRDGCAEMEDDTGHDTEGFYDVTTSRLSGESDGTDEDGTDEDGTDEDGTDESDEGSGA